MHVCSQSWRCICRAIKVMSLDSVDAKEGKWERQQVGAAAGGSHQEAAVTYRHAAAHRLACLLAACHTVCMTASCT